MLIVCLCFPVLIVIIIVGDGQQAPFRAHRHEMLRSIHALQHRHHRQKRDGPRTGQSHPRVPPPSHRQQVRYGGDFELSEEKQRILQEAEEYLDNHMGYRYLNRSRTEELYEQQLTKKLMEKEEALKETSPEDVERVEKLKSHIEQLKKAYQSVLPKMPTSWDDLKEKDEEE